MKPQAGTSRDAAEQFVLVAVGAEEFAIPIGQIVEFRTWSQPAALPNAPDYMLGIVNVRGDIVPVLDLPRRLGRAATVPGPRHVIVLARTDDDRTVGLLVDGVSDIMTVSNDLVTPPPRVDRPDAVPFLRGLISADGDVVAVLDVSVLPTGGAPPPAERAP